MIYIEWNDIFTGRCWNCHTLCSWEFPICLFCRGLIEAQLREGQTFDEVLMPSESRSLIEWKGWQEQRPK